MAADRAQPDGRVFEVAPGVMGIDLHFRERPHLIASYVVTGPGGRFALVEAGPESTLEHLKAGLRVLGLDFSGLEAVLVTHIHLDHAGAAGALARAAGCPVYVHESGAPHLADPARLWSSAARLFGADMDRLWKGITPVPEGQLRPLGREATLQVAGRSLAAYHTPGHASHHVIYRLEEGVVFAGDAAGVRIPGIPYVWPPTPPPDLSLEDWDQTIDLLRRLSPRRLAVGHFGVYGGDLSWHLDVLKVRLHHWAARVRAALCEGRPEQAIIDGLRSLVASDWDALPVDPGRWADYQAVSPMDHNALGLIRYWKKRGIGGAASGPAGTASASAS